MVLLAGGDWQTTTSTQPVVFDEFCVGVTDRVDICIRVNFDPKTSQAHAGIALKVWDKPVLAYSFELKPKTPTPACWSVTVPLSLTRKYSFTICLDCENRLVVTSMEDCNLRHGGLRYWWKFWWECVSMHKDVKFPWERAKRDAASYPSGIRPMPWRQLI
jgi:hypothetical protein